jgi:hypothetical protein
MGRCVFAGALAVLLGLLAAPAASAEPLPPELGQQLDAIVEQNYRGSAQPSPPACSATCQQLWAAETRPGQTGLAGAGERTGLEALQRESRSLRIATRLMPALRVLGEAHLAFETGRLGWRIGSWANNKFLRVGLPPTVNYSSAITDQRIRFRAAGENLTPYTPSPMPEDGWVWEYTQGGGYWYGYWQSPGCEPSPHQRSGPGGRFVDVTWSTDTVFCWTGDYPNQRLPMFASYVSENSLEADAPVADYAGQSYDIWSSPPPDPGESSVRDQIEDELEAGHFPTLREKYEYELGVPGACDPVEPNVCNLPEESNRAKEMRCDLGSGGEQQDPDASRGNTTNDPALYVVHTPLERRPVDGGPSDRTPTAMKKGWTEDVGGKREWAGWGWRHVAAKHGWSQADIDATAAALINEPEPQPNGRLYYRGDEYTQNGARCKRLVVLADTPRSGEPAAKEIITTFGEFLEYTTP